MRYTFADTVRNAHPLAVRIIVFAYEAIYVRICEGELVETGSEGNDAVEATSLLEQPQRLGVRTVPTGTRPEIERDLKERL